MGLGSEIGTLELIFVLAGFATIGITRGFPFGALRVVGTVGSQVARNSWLAVALSFVLPVLLRLLLLPLRGIPAPSVQDEFSFLLMADTFAHGRVANPTHPLWIHFETIHVLQHPTYSSIYPVMQGVFLSVGQIVFHRPWLGVVLSVGLMCAAICWALQAWLPPLWALAGAVLAAVRFGVCGYWMNSYWGGAAGAIGGALVIGALPRVLRRAKTVDAVILAGGFAVLANSRPYEGFFFSLPALIVFVGWVLGAERFCRWCGFRFVARPSFRTIMVRVLVPAAIVLIVTGVFMGYYFWRVTGNPLTMPYVAEARQYGVTPLFIWQKLRPAPTYNDDRLRYFYTHTAPQMRTSEISRLSMYGIFYLGTALSVPLLVTLPWIVSRRRTRFLLITTAFVILAVVMEWWALPHYAAPVLAAFCGLLMQSFRYLRCLTRHTRWRHAGSVILAAVLGIFVIQLTIVARSAIQSSSSPGFTNPMQSRAEVERRLRAAGGRHLVIVRYTNHDREAAIHNEWVYNRADIDNSQIVWARELDEEHNRKLLEYFQGRQVWLADPDAGTFVELNRPR